MSVSPMPNVTIDGSGGGRSAAQQAEYERQARGVFQTVRQNPVGRHILGAMTRSLRIVPYTGSTRNATAGPTNSQAARVEGRRMYSCRDGTPRNTTSGQPLRGTGGGSNSVVRFTPSQWLTSGIAQHRGSTVRPGARRDEILFHEIVHALRQMAGRMNCSVARPGFDTKAELWSIAVTNVYSSYWNRPLRRNHHGFQAMSATEAASFYTTHHRLIGVMCQEQATLTRNLSRVQASFNPFRDHYRHAARP